MRMIFNKGGEQAMTNLMDVKPGCKAVVAGITGSGALRRRMLDMGILPGVEMEVVRQAPWGGPIQLRLRGYFLAMRRSECAHIAVVPNIDISLVG